MRVRLSRLAWAVPLVAGLGAVAAGCGTGSTTAPAPATTKIADAAPTGGTAVPTGRTVAPMPAPGKSAPVTPAEVTLTEVRADELAAALKKHKDKVVAVDFWAMWCTPCKKKFPHLVEMHTKYADKGLVCVSVCLDRLGGGEHKKDAALGFLKDKGAAFPNYVATSPDDDDKKLETLFGEDFRIIPYMVIYDKAGRKAWDSAGTEPPLTDEQLDKKVEELLAK